MEETGLKLGTQTHWRLTTRIFLKYVYNKQVHYNENIELLVTVLEM